MKPGLEGIIIPYYNSSPNTMNLNQGGVSFVSFLGLYKLKGYAARVGVCASS
jgi:hypothetical protein